MLASPGIACSANIFIIYVRGLIQSWRSSHVLQHYTKLHHTHTTLQLLHYTKLHHTHTKLHLCITTLHHTIQNHNGQGMATTTNLIYQGKQSSRNMGCCDMTLALIVLFCTLNKLHSSKKHITHLIFKYFFLSTGILPANCIVLVLQSTSSDL